MYEEVQVLAHSSIRIKNGMTVYFDPFHVKEEYHDADIIFVTHNHFDHYSPEDIAKVKNKTSVLVCPSAMEACLLSSGIGDEYIELVEPGDSLEINDVRIDVVPAYNVGKAFHPRENRWVGYIVTMNGTRYYVAGDTDSNADVMQVHCDVALLPVGGTYTMTAEEAAKLAVKIQPEVAIPTHYGDIVGDPQDGARFIEALGGQVPGVLRMI
ncbi:MAG: MBL fold metallo-hydrolase [Eubacterium sp.]|nr:MBL fold metallo-hydrolase [Eubacterium sp.]